MSPARKTGVSHLHAQPTAPTSSDATEPSPAPDPVLDRVFPVGTHQFSDESGEYAVDPETGKVTRKL